MSFQQGNKASTNFLFVPNLEFSANKAKNIHFGMHKILISEKYRTRQIFRKCIYISLAVTFYSIVEDMLDKSRNQRHMDPRLMEPRHMDPRHIDQRSTMDPRLHVPRQFDLRQSSRLVSSSMDPRQLDPRLVSSRNLDPRLYTSSATVAGGGGGRRRQVESDEVTNHRNRLI